MSKVFTITAGLENMGAMKTGGQGSVYKGKRIGEIITAIKLLPTPIHSESSDDKNFIAFSNEVQKLKKVNENPNPNVVKILSSGITDTGNLPFIEMEYIEGPDLEELLKPPHDPVFTIKEVVKVANHLSNALAHCHKLGIKHGDIKSNNVKFNIHTGNYMLLDFGLAVMSDEQRRSSLRHAGAIEFMAPEQAEGHSLFETDVYSFGIVLYELIAGTVPFPLKDKGETARNKILVSHMEAPVPDLLQLRQQALPESWSIAKREQEMQVPDWLVKLVYKCLEKKPEKRFPNGDDLHDSIWQNLGGFAGPTANNSVVLEQEVRRLRMENEQLKQQVNTQQRKPMPSSIASTTPRTYQPPETATIATTSPGESAAYYAAYRKKESNATPWIFAAIILAGLGLAAYLLVKSNGSKVDSKKVAGTTTQKNSTDNGQPGRLLIAEYKVVVPRAFFHDEPDDATRRNAYAVPSEIPIKALKEENGFVYTEVRNERNQISKGWLRKEDLKTAQQAASSPATPPTTTASVDIDAVRASLRTAQQYVNDDNIGEALPIYEELIKREIPEAMYQYANLAIKDQNNNIDCKRAFELMSQAANKGHILSKRTLGFLYVFADDRYILEEQNYYARCTITRNVPRGSKLLLEAMVAGDSTAARYVRDMNAQQQ